MDICDSSPLSGFVVAKLIVFKGHSDKFIILGLNGNSELELFESSETVLLSSSIQMFLHHTAIKILCQFSLKILSFEKHVTITEPKKPQFWLFSVSFP